MVIAALADLIDRDRWSGFIVSPATILRWHPELVRRKWTFRHRKAGRPEGVENPEGVGNSRPRYAARP